jgi:hypothetical protein
VKPIRDDLRTPRFDPRMQTGPCRDDPKVACETELKDRFEGRRKAVRDPARNHGNYGLWAPSDRIDGFFVAGDQRLYPPAADLFALPPVVASNRTDSTPMPPKQRIDVVYVNGIGTPAAQQLEDMQATADFMSVKGGLHAEVRGIHNGTDGAVQDVLQAAGDKFGIGRNRAVDTLKGVVLDRVASGKPLNLVVHSHGTIIASRALREAKLALVMEHGKSRSEAESALADTVRVMTTGNASWRFPDGPKYVHVMNTRDRVTVGLGLGSHPDVRSPNGGGLFRAGGRLLAWAGRGLRTVTEGDTGPTYQPGRDSQFVVFDRKVGSEGGKAGSHSYRAAYLPEIRSRLSELAGTPDRGGFFLPAHYRTGAPSEKSAVGAVA